VIVVIGGGGYIGSVTVERLVADGYDVLVWDDFSLGHRWAVPDVAETVEADLADRPTIERVAGNHDVEAVMHFAALAKVGESVEQPRRYWRENALKSIEAFETWQNHGVDRFIFSSTAAVYGEPREIPITESHPTAPINPYGRTKRTIEWYLEDVHGAADIRSASLRYFNAAGAGDAVGEDHDPETHLIPIVLEAALGERDGVEIYGTNYDTRDGTCLRDFVHVKDIADAHVRALERLDELGCERINLGTGNGHTVREVIDVAGEVTGRSFEVREGDRRPGDPPRLVADYERARELLDWEPERDLEETVADAWQWMCENSSQTDWEP
jgi:UDP-glucose 4-epimerase